MTAVRAKLPFYLLLASLAAILFFLRPDASATVVITDEGFNPLQLEVSLGATVIFKNDGSKLHWPASNFHPTHKLYPEDGGCIGSKFDACKGLGSGESYQFTFTKEGSWAVHDHLFPGLTMVVEVKGKHDQGKSKVIKNYDLPSPDSFRGMSYVDQIKLVRAQTVNDPAALWQYIKSAFVVNGQVLGNAHEFAHVIGNALYDKYGLPGVGYCDETFAFGCYHGVSEKMLSLEGPDSVRDSQEECLKIFPPEDYNYTGCIHGMGHGLLTWRNLDVKTALADCDALDSAYRSFCYDGVFMENALVAPQQASEPEDLWKLCKSLDNRYHYNCARYQSQAIRSFYGDDLNKVAQACQNADDASMEKACIESIGYYVSQQAGGKAPEITILCSKILDKDQYTTCIIAGARETIFQKYNEWEKTAQALCQPLDVASRELCLASNEKVKQQYKR